MSVVHSVHQPSAGRSAATELCRRLVGPVSQLITASAVLLAAFLSWSLWQTFPFAQPSSLELHLRLGLGGALIAGLFTVLRGEHRLPFLAAGENTLSKTLNVWNMTVAVLLLMAFLVRRVEELSRGTAVLFYISGFFALWSSRSVATRLVRAAARHRIIVGQRLLVVGTEDGISAFLRRYRPWDLGFDVVGTVSVDPVRTGRPAPNAEFQRAVDLTRALAVDEVYIAVPWAETQTIDLCVEAMLNLPVAIHLAPEEVLDRFDRVTIARVGPMASLELTRPMSPFWLFAKRVVDMVLSGLAVVLLSPLALMVALAIKLDSPGPVLFFQTRYGFNQRRFRIVKFRTMTTFADVGPVPQAERDDPRITRVGKLLRRSNLDELPQLLNVIAGQMSLVGPRPHAVPHNRSFERRIALYARRHNVRPGITGWAQVNGLRGETDTDVKMRARVEHDLYYIDNWSLLFDLRIMLRTVFSRGAYRNAY